MIPRKTLGAKINTNNKLIPHVTPTQATVVGGKHSCYCTIPAPMLNLEVKCCGEDPRLRSVHFPLPPHPPSPPLPPRCLNQSKLQLSHTNYSRV